MEGEMPPQGSGEKSGSSQKHDHAELERMQKAFLDLRQLLSSKTSSGMTGAEVLEAMNHPVTP